MRSESGDPPQAADALSVLAAAREAGDRPALIVDERVLTFAELAALTRERLRTMGPPPADGAPLPVTGSNTPETAITLYALLEQRRAALLLHPRLTGPERETLLAAARDAGPLPAPDAAAVMFTSGTTGTPRAAVLTRGALLASARASEANLGWQPDDRWLMCMPIAHVGGLSILTRCLAARRCVALSQGFDAAALPAQLERDRVTLLSLVPTMLARLLDAHPRWRGAPSLRAILLGGAAASPKLLARAAQRGLPLLASYGLTESCAQVCATRYDERFSALQGDAGEPLPGVRLRVVDGRIQVAGPTMMAGYWGEPPLAPGAWFDTGDLGEIDARERVPGRGRAGARGLPRRRGGGRVRRAGRAVGTDGRRGAGRRRPPADRHGAARAPGRAARAAQAAAAGVLGGRVAPDGRQQARPPGARGPGRRVEAVVPGRRHRRLTRPATSSGSRCRPGSR